MALLPPPGAALIPAPGGHHLPRQDAVRREPRDARGRQCVLGLWPRPRVCACRVPAFKRAARPPRCCRPQAVGILVQRAMPVSASNLVTMILEDSKLLHR